MNNIDEKEMIEIVHIINKELRGKDFNISFQVFLTLIRIHFICESPDENTLEWIKEKLEILTSGMEEYIREKYNDKQK